MMLYRPYLVKVRYKSSESTGLSFAFHKFEDISNSDWALDIADKVTLISLFSRDEDDFDLGDTSSRSGSAQQLRDSGFDWL